MSGLHGCRRASRPRAWRPDVARPVPRRLTPGSSGRDPAVAREAAGRPNATGPSTSHRRTGPIAARPPIPTTPTAAARSPFTKLACVSVARWGEQRAPDPQHASATSTGRRAIAQSDATPNQTADREHPAAPEPVTSAPPRRMNDARVRGSPTTHWRPLTRRRDRADEWSATFTIVASSIAVELANTVANARCDQGAVQRAATGAATITRAYGPRFGLW